MMSRIALLLSILLSAVLSCLAQTAPSSNHIVVVAFENQSYEDVVGSPSMPYLNSLIGQGALATKFYADYHGSISAYFMLTVGESVTTNSSFTEKITIDNIVRQLAAANKTWKSYNQSLPSVGFLGSTSGEYVKWHNPFAYFTEITSNPAQAANIVPITQLSADLANNALPNFSFVVPDNANNSHDCPNGVATCTNGDKLGAADQFLQTNVAPILSNPVFQQDGLLVLWFDEGNAADNANGGGHVAVVFAGPRAKVGFQSTTFYRHEHLLRTIAEALNLPGFPNSSQYVSSMAEMMSIATPPPSGPGTITGTVRFAQNNSALSGATITYSGGSALSDAAGRYTLSNVPAGTYSVSASKSGFFVQTQQVTVATSTASTADFNLATGGKVAGKVTSATTGAAISGATIQLSGGLQPTTVTLKTSSTGSYASNYIPIGTYTATVSAAGHASKTATVNVSTGATTTLNVGLN
jgi:phosphatidylinositol-3-phosphatase